MKRKMILAAFAACFALAGCAGNATSGGASSSGAGSSAGSSSGGAQGSSSSSPSSGNASSGESGGAKSSSSSSGSSSSTHTHTYSSSWSSDPTYHWHESTCGHEASEKEEHSFVKKSTVSPTYEKGGYTVYECSVCHYSYNGDETAKLDPSSLGVDPSFSDDNKSVTYGLYPQTHVSDEELITSLDALTTTASNGWYLYDGAYYAKKSATPCKSSYEFSDGTTIAEGTAYWFKCEPIEWKVLSSSDGTYSLVSSVLLDAHYYHSSTGDRIIDGETIYANNYEHSDIREWLNDEFYNSAFSLDSSLIQTVTVDNSASTTGYSANEYACNNTKDKVYLLSYADYKNADYFADDAARCCKTTDWARASGAYYNTYPSLGDGYYWTRSPNAVGSSAASYVYHDGDIDDWTHVFHSSYGVRPGLTIKINGDETSKLDSSALGINPLFSEDYDNVTYGLYPQTHVSDETLISSLDALETAESNGWYLYEGSYYAKKSATPCDSSCEFSDGTKIAEGTAYWFKCEPIEWKVLSLPSDGTYSLVSSVLLDAHCYHSSDNNRTIGGKAIYPNNYEYSDIRSWLNDEFYKSAFSLSSSLIQTVTVDNSVSTTGYSANEYACNNTKDKVYLLSYADYKNADYFADDAARCCKTTDWVRASGAWYNMSSSYSGNGDYWTRSPIAVNSSNARIVDNAGLINWGDHVRDSIHGVRPGIQIKIA